MIRCVWGGFLNVNISRQKKKRHAISLVWYFLTFSPPHTVITILAHSNSLPKCMFYRRYSPEERGEEKVEKFANQDKFFREMIYRWIAPQMFNSKCT